jgi:CheY-like chemotaxis protein
MVEKLNRLLIVEDNDADVFLIKRALEENQIPADVTVCSNGEAAVSLLNSPEMQTPPDAIIVDLALPRLEGLEVLRRILHHPAFVGTPIMVFTSSPSPADKHRVELLAGARYVQKPSGLDTYLRLIDENVRSMFAESAKNKARSQEG